MADLVTHLCVVLLPAALLPRRGLPLVVLGAVLPDLAARVPAMALEEVAERVPLPEWLLPGWTALHEPLPLAALCVVLACVMVREDRRRALGCLAVGAASHIGLDVLQDHHGHGYRLLFPLSWSDFELACFGAQATVPWAPWLGLATAVAWALRLGWSRDGGPTDVGQGPPSVE